MVKNKYVLGLMFNPEKTAVVVIQKTHPDWQAGLFNGVGGHIEEGETSADAMVREFKEETGVETTILDWEWFAEISGDDWHCDCFKSFSPLYLSAKTTTDEQIYLMAIPMDLKLLNTDVGLVPSLGPLIISALEGPIKHEVIKTGETNMKDRAKLNNIVELLQTFLPNYLFEPNDKKTNDKIISALTPWISLVDDKVQIYCVNLFSTMWSTNTLLVNVYLPTLNTIFECILGKKSLEVITEKKINESWTK